MGKKAAKKHPSLFHYEQLEQRILFSGDIAPGVDTTDVVEHVIAADETDDVPVESEAVPETTVQTETQQQWELVLVNGNVADYEQLIAGLQSEDGDRIFEVVVLDADRGGIAQVSEILAERSELSAIHIITHGAEGRVNLGSDWLDSLSLQQNAEQIASWGEALTEEGDILLYGCNVANEARQSFIGNLAELTGADVAASDDVTGHAELGGDWQLESQTGDITTSIAPTVEAIKVWQSTLESASFQEGTDSYSGTLDTYLDENNLTSNAAGAYSSVSVDLQDVGGLETQGLIRFDNLFGNSAGQIPLGSTIHSASLTLEITNESSNDASITLHRMLAGWDELSSWDSMTNGLQSPSEYAVTASSTLPNPDALGTNVFAGLASDLQNWSDGGTNYGWAILSSSTNGWEFNSSEFATVSTRPQLQVNYTAPTGNQAPTDIQISSTSEGGLSLNEDGGNDAYLVADDGDAILGGLNQLTAEFSFLSNGIEDSPSLLSYATATEDNELALLFGTSSGNVHLYVGGNNLNTGYSFAPLHDGAVHSLAVTWDNTNGDWSLVVDGVLQASDTGHAKGVTLDVGGTLVVGNDQDAFGSDFSTGQELAGVIYDVRIFDDVRTDQEIAASYRSNLPYDTAGLIANWRFDQLSADNVVTDTVSGNNLTLKHTSESGFSPSTPSLTFAIDENAPTGTVVGTVQGIDAERDAQIASLLAADANLSHSAETGKFYKVVVGWFEPGEARTNAENTTLNTVNGQLVTIRSAHENEFVRGISSSVTTSIWLGGTDATVEGEWRWIESGAEADPFWSGAANGSAVNGAYQNWVSASQPNDTGDEDQIRMEQSTGAWWDDKAPEVHSYVVEWQADEVLDASDALTYSILSQTVAGAFAIDTDSGEITVADGLSLDFETNPTHTLNVRVTDSGGLTFDKAFTVALRDANDVPTITSTAVTTATEDSLYSYTFTVNDADGDTLTLSAPTLPGWLNFDSGTGVLSGTPTNAEVGNHTVTLRVNDGTVDLEQSFNIAVVNVNDAPVLDNNGGFALTGISEDDLNNSGDLVSDIIASGGTNKITDDDAGAVEGIAIFSLSNGNGTWEFNTGSGWTATGTVSITNSLLLRSTDSLRFVPNGETGGNQQVGFAAWDQTSGSAGAKVDTSTVGGTSAFSSATVVADLSVSEINDAPVLGAIGNQTVDEGSTLSFTASATDSDLPADTLTYSLDATSLALGMTINSSSGAFTWTPSESQGGLTPSVTITVTDNGTSSLTDSESFTITVNDTNTAPVLSAIGNQTVNEGNTLSFTASTTDTDLPTDTLTYSLDSASLALGMTINSSTGAFSWTPSEAQGGLTPSVTITVTDNGTGNLTDSETFTITVNDTNSAPLLSAIGNQTVDEGSTLIFTADATDTDLPTDTLTYSLDSASLALGMTINSSTGAFSWTPTETQGGLTPSVTITVTDNGTGSLTDSETFTITVNDTNTAPMLSAIGDQTVNEGATLSFTASATDTDLPTETLTYSLDSASLALGMTINSSTGAFSWTPTEGQGGMTPSVTITVTDNGTGSLTNSETFTITVNDTNTAPVLAAIGNQAVNEGATLSFTASATDTDLPSDTLTYSLDSASLALGMTINSSTGAFSWTPTESQGGLTPSVTITVSDGSQTDSESFTITVNDTNSAPVLSAIGNQTVDEGNTLSFTASAIDTDLPTDTLTYSLDSASLALGMTINSSTGAFSWTPSESQGGLTPPVTITVSDGSQTDSETFTITVNDTNTAPVLAAIGNQTVNEGATLSFTASATDTDLPADTLTYSLDSASLSLGMTINSSTGAFSWTPTESQGGLTPPVTITVSDGSQTDSETFTITVIEVNDNDPVAVNDTITVSEGGTTTFLNSGAVTVLANDADGDLPNDTLTVAVDTDVSHGTLTLNANGTFSYTHDGSEHFSDSFTYIVSDADGGTTATGTVSITIHALNDAPQASNTSIDGQEDTVYIGALPAASDAEGDGIAYLLDTDAMNGTVIINTAGSFSYTPDLNLHGPDSFTYSVRDVNGGINTYTVSIDIAARNDDPVFVSGGLSPGIEDSAFSQTIVTRDVDGDTLTITATAMPAWLSIVDNGDGTATLHGTPSAHAVGNHNIVLEVFDGLAITRQNLALNVTASAVTLPEDDTDGGISDENPPDDPQNDPIDDTVHGIIQNPDNNDAKEDDLPDIGNPFDNQHPGGPEATITLDPESPGTEADIIYLTDESVADQTDEGNRADRAGVYMDTRPLEKSYFSFLMTSKSMFQKNTLSAENPNIQGPIDSDGVDINYADGVEMHESIHRSVEDVFDTELKNQTTKTKIVTITAASFTAGIVTYLLRAGSMVASLMSSIPLWQRFDPIAVFSGRKKKRHENESPKSQSNEATGESLFEDEGE